jgi:hypothetical protein
MLIDLSDTTNWPHTGTDHIHLRWLSINITPDASYLGDIRLGFLSAVDATDGDFNDIWNIKMSKKSDVLTETVLFASEGIHCELADWFGPTLANSTLFQTDVNLGGPDGATSYPSGAGDLVLLVEVAAGTVEVSISLGYETIT